MFDPLNVRKLPDNTLFDEYQRLSDLGEEKAWPSIPGEKGTITVIKENGDKEKLEYKMDENNYNLFREITGKLMKSAQEEFISSSEYEALDDTTKAKKLYDIYEKSRDTAKALVLPLVFEQSDVKSEAEKLFTQDKIKDIRLDLVEKRPTIPSLKLRDQKVQDLVFN